jgi:hypothetical protein
MYLLVTKDLNLSVPHSLTIIKEQLTVKNKIIWSFESDIQYYFLLRLECER